MLSRKLDARYTQLFFKYSQIFLSLIFFSFFYKDNPRRPYPTDADMRKGWLAKMNTITDLSVMAPDPAEAGANLQKTLIRSNSKSII